MKPADRSCPQALRLRYATVALSILFFGLTGFAYTKLSDLVYINILMPFWGYPTSSTIEIPASYPTAIHKYIVQSSEFNSGGRLPPQLRSRHIIPSICGSAKITGRNLIPTASTAKMPRT